MRSFLRFTSCFVIGAVFIAALSVSSHAAVISFNSRGGSGTAMGATETAGAPGVSVSNWNDMNSTTAGAGQAIAGTLAAGAIKDSTGAVLATTSLTWSGTGVANASGSGTGTDKMFTSEWDLFDNGSNTSVRDMRFTVTDVPYALYDVYFYVQDANNAATRGGDVVANGVTESITMFNWPGTDYVEADSKFTWNVSTTDVGRYLRIQDLSGDLTLDIFSKNTPTPRLRMSGFQIAEVPEPATLSLAALGLLGLRRRKR